MICQECGAYNPDHANYCKVCSAALKESEPQQYEEAAEAAEPEKEAAAPLEPEQGTTRFTPVRRPVAAAPVEEEDEPAPVKRAASKQSKKPAEWDEEEEEEEVAPKKRGGLFARKPLVEEDEYEDEDEEEEEEITPKKRGGLFARKSAPAEEEEDEDEYEDEEEEITPKKRVGLFARKSAPVEEEEDEDEYEDEEEEEVAPKKRGGLFARKPAPVEDEEEEEEEDEDEYEEYEPTPPRKGKKQKGVSIVAILLAVVALLIVFMACIIVYCNRSGGELQQRLPSFLQFNCKGNEPTYNPDPAQNPQGGDDQQPQPGSDVSGNAFDYNMTRIEDTTNGEGQACKKIYVFLKPGETVTLVLPNQAPFTYTNETDVVRDLGIEIPTICFNPNQPLEAPEYTVTPELYVTAADGTRTLRQVDPFTLTFPTVSLQLENPANVTGEGIMADKNNTLFISGQVDDHTVEVYANDVKLGVYQEGKFSGDYVLEGSEAQDLTIKAVKENCVTATYTFTVLPYVYTPETMVLTVDGEADSHRADDKATRLTIRGTVSPGSTITASCEDSHIACGTPLVNADGTYSMDVSFEKNTYGLFTVKIKATQEGYQDGEINCYVARMFKDKDDATKAYNKGAGYKECYKSVTIKELLDNNQHGMMVRFAGKVVAVEKVDGLEVVTFAAKSAAKETVNIYVINMSDKWTPAEKVGNSYLIYTTGNGLYTDGTSLYTIAWFAKND